MTFFSVGFSQKHCRRPHKFIKKETDLDANLQYFISIIENSQ